MAKLFTYTIILLLAVSCTSRNQTVSDEIPPIYPAPQTVALNIEEGYSINQYTGDSIQPKINSIGDTIKTGVPVLIKGTIIPMGKVQIKSTLAKEPKVVSAKLKIIKVPETLTVIRVNKDSLKTFTPGVDISSSVLVNDIGDTIPSGVPISIKNKGVPTKYPQPVKALAPSMKDNASINIRYLDVDHGMKSVFVYGLFEDSRGNIWIGIIGGVSKYNGETFTHFTEEEGFSNSLITAFLEDSHGNLWFCTYHDGIFMYNGETFTRFSEREDRFSKNRVQSIIEDSHGNIWFGTTGGGAIMFNGEAYTRFTTKEGLLDNRVSSVLEDGYGNIWLGTYGGASRYNGETFTHFTEKEGLINNRILSMLEDKYGNLWFGTRQGVCNLDLSRTKDYSFTHFTEKEGLINNDITFMLEDKHGNLWFGTPRGVCKLVIRNDKDDNAKTLPAKQSSFTHFIKKDGSGDYRVQIIHEDSNGNIWFGTRNGGVGKIAQNGFEEFNANTSSARQESYTMITEKEGLSGNNVLHILEDSHGTLWFGTLGNGVNIYKDKSFKYFTNIEGISGYRVLSIEEDKQGNLWFGTWGAGMSRLKSKTLSAGQPAFKYLTKDEGFGQGVIYAIKEDSQGNIWFSLSASGVRMYDGKTILRFDQMKGPVLSIFEDSRGNLWFSNSILGVFMFDGETFTRFSKKEGLIGNSARSIIEDSQGSIWIAFNDGGGVSKLDLNDSKDYDGQQVSIIHFTEKEGLSSNNVFSLLEDMQGNIWIGTNNGVCVYNGNNLPLEQASFTYFTKEEGLNYNIVSSMQEDNNGNIWVGTWGGVNLLAFTPDSVKTTSNIRVLNTYSKLDGLKDLSFQVNSVLLDSKNRIWWGTGEIATMLDLNNFKIQADPPAIQLNGIDINQQFADYRNLKDNAGTEMEFDDVAGFYNYPLNLKLPYNQNHLTFHFSAIDWAAPHKIRYSYKIDGLDDVWSKPTEEAKVDYRNLPFGTFKFRVKAIGKAQKWSEPFEYTFTISPPWWKTWWANVSYAIMGIALIYALFFYRLTRMLRISQLESKALRAQMNPHFLSNALSGLQSVMILKGEREANQYFGFFSKLLHLTLGMSNSDYILLKDEVTYLKSYLELEKLRLNKELEINFDIKSDLNLENYEIPCMLFQPIIENAVIHGLWSKKSDRVISVSFERQDKMLKGSVIDNGIGREASQKKKESKQSHQSSWATKIMNDRISLSNKLHKDKISFIIFDLKEGDKALGTKVILNIPLKKVV